MEGGAGRCNEKYVLQRKVVEGGRGGEETECVKSEGDNKRQKRQQEEEEQERTSRFAGIISYVVLLLFVLSVSFLLWGGATRAHLLHPTNQSWSLVVGCWSRGTT